jgi:hypothetical protein
MIIITLSKISTEYYLKSDSEISSNMLVHAFSYFFTQKLSQCLYSPKFDQNKIAKTDRRPKTLFRTQPRRPTLPTGQLWQTTVVSTIPWYSWDLWLKYRPGDELSGHRCFVVFLGPSRKMPGYFFSIRPLPLPSTFFRIQYSLIVLQLEAVINKYINKREKVYSWMKTWCCFTGNSDVLTRS